MKRYIGLGNVESVENSRRITRLKDEQGELQVLDNLILGISLNHGYVQNADEAGLWGSEDAIVGSIDRHSGIILDTV